MHQLKKEGCGFDPVQRVLPNQPRGTSSPHHKGDKEIGIWPGLSDSSGPKYTASHGTYFCGDVLWEQHYLAGPGLSFLQIILEELLNGVASPRNLYRPACKVFEVFTPLACLACLNKCHDLSWFVLLSLFFCLFVCCYKTRKSLPRLPPWARVEPPGAYPIWFCLSDSDTRTSDN